MNIKFIFLSNAYPDNHFFISQITKHSDMFNKPDYYQVIFYNDTLLSYSKLLAYDANLKIITENNYQILHLCIHRCIINRKKSNYFKYQIDLYSPIYKLLQVKHYEVFRDYNIRKVITNVINRSKLQIKIKWKTNQNFLTKPLLVQYNESDLDFILRISQEENLIFYNNHSDSDFEIIFYNQKDFMFYPKKDSFLYYQANTGLLENHSNIFDYEHVTLQQKNKYEELTIKTNDPTLKSGSLIEIRGLPERSLNKIYSIVKVNHKLKMSNHYSNKALLIPADQNKLPILSPKHIKCYSYVLLGTIKHSKKSDQERSEKNIYPVAFDFDPHQTSCCLPLLQRYSSMKSKLFGIHFILSTNTRVAIQCIQGDIKNAFIVGVIPNTGNPNVIKNEYSKKNIIRLPSQQSIEIDESSVESSIKISNCHKTQIISMNTKNDKSFKWFDKNGLIEIMINNKILFKSNKSIISQSEKNIDYCADNNFIVEVKLGEMFIHSGNKIQGYSKEYLLKSNEIAIEASYQDYTVNDYLKVISKKNMSFFVQENVLKMKSKKSSFLSQKGTIYISNGQAKIEILPSGYLQIQGRKIIFKSKEIHAKGSQWLNPSSFS